MNSDRFISVMAGDGRSASATAARIFLSAGEPFYRGAIALRNAAFDRGWRKPRRLPRPVLSVGNLTTGGTGKTPMVIHLARQLTGMGARPAVLLRGYGGGPGPSDEALVLAGELGAGVPVAAGPDRVASARRVLREHPGVNLFLLDDGFQHRQAARELDIVLIDATEPWGFGRLLPRGLLREPVSALARADAVIVTRADLVSKEELAAVDARVAAVAGRPPAAHVAFGWTGFRDERDAAVGLDAFRGQTVLGVCGIGNPRAFWLMLDRVAGKAAHQVLEDHAVYTPAMVREIMAEAEKAGAAGVVTTEKDWVKWKPLLGEAGLGERASGGVRVFRPVLGVELMDGGMNIDQLLRTRL